MNTDPKRISAKPVMLFTFIFILIWYSALGIACPCDPPAPPCHSCESGVWVHDCPGDCCGGSCCSSTCCNDVCCGSGDTCCDGSCCDGPCCNDVCCGSGDTCCDGSCCDGPCCNDVCCGSGEDCCGATCYDPSTQGCCDGTIYTLATQKCCDDGPFGKYTCGISLACCIGSCCVSGEACCETGILSGTCYNTTTQKCCPTGDPPYLCDIDEVCCDYDDSCAEPCDEWGDGGVTCSSSNNSPCIACVGALGNCSDNKELVYLNNEVYDCSGGCPGAPPDCSSFNNDGVDCYDEYLCTDNGIPYVMAHCTSMSETGPIPLECYSTTIPLGCTRCQKGGFYQTMTVASPTCQE